MAYNHRKAELQWLKWKLQEEKQLRELGVNDDTIQKLHEYDWEQFKKERNFYEWQENTEHVIGWQSNDKRTEQIKDVESFLEEIENERLLHILQGMDKQTLEMIVMRLAGYNGKEISHKMGVSVYAYYNRIKYLKKKIRKIWGE